MADATMQRMQPPPSQESWYQNPGFFDRAVRPSLADIVEWTNAQASAGADLSLLVDRLAPLDEAGSGALVFLDNPKYATELAHCQATACFVAEKFAGRVPKNIVALVTPDPYKSYAITAAKMYPQATLPATNFAASGLSPGVFVHPTARLEDGVIVDPGAVIGPGAAVGSGSVIGAGAVIGPNVQIGRNCTVGPGSTLLCALVGDDVIIHSGVRIGQDGFGFAMGPGGHLKVPQIGRVIIQNDVEIGANSTIDRGANRDTIIGEGSKIDNLVQIAHNVVIGRHCVIVAQVGISGSAELADYVAVGGQAGIAGHLTIGMGAQIAAQSGVMTSVPAGARYGGTPAQPLPDFWRSLAAIARLTRKGKKPRASHE